MGAFDTSLGVLLIGIFVNTYLYGLVTLQYGYYVASGYKDRLWVKLMVSTLFVMDTVHTASVIYMAWIYGVEHFTDPTALLNCYWPYPFTALVTVCTAYLVQSFLTFRIWKLTYNRVLTGFVFAVASGTFVLGLGTCIKVWDVTLMADLMSYRPLYAAWLSMEVTVDLVIAAIMVYNLSNSKTGFKNSDNVINRLVRMSIQTGTLAGIFAILALTFFFTSPTTHFFAMFGIPISRVYSNTFMHTLLARNQLREMLFTRTATAESTARRGQGTSTNTTIQLHVRKEVHTVIDENESINQKPKLKLSRAYNIA